MQLCTFPAHVYAYLFEGAAVKSGSGSGLVKLRSTNGVSEKVKLEPFLSVTLSHPC